MSNDLNYTFTRRDNEHDEHDKLGHVHEARTSQSSNDPSEQADTIVQHPSVTQQAETVGSVTPTFVMLEQTSVYLHGVLQPKMYLIIWK